jgi:hypothetical protein
MNLLTVAQIIVLVIWIETVLFVPERVRDYNHARAREIRDELLLLRAKSEEVSAPSDDPLDGLERLATLREQGHLSDEEFESQKRKILGD